MCARSSVIRFYGRTLAQEFADLGQFVAENG